MSTIILRLIINLVLLMIMGYVLLDELVLLRRRRQTLLHRISLSRLCFRILITIIILLAFFMAKDIVAGAYIGYITNALVTIIILKFYIPSQKAQIASSIGQSMRDLFGDANEDSADESRGSDKGKGLLFGLATGLFVPGGWITTLLGGLGGTLAQKAIQKHKADEKERELASIVDKIKAMSRQEITDLIDNIIGRVFVVLEILGLLFGMGLDFVFGKLF